MKALEGDHALQFTDARTSDIRICSWACIGVVSCPTTTYLYSKYLDTSWQCITDLVSVCTRTIK